MVGARGFEPLTPAVSIWSTLCLPLSIGVNERPFPGLYRVRKVHRYRSLSTDTCRRVCTLVCTANAQDPSLGSYSAHTV
jgi:hypothetical protein